jgi:hypothetical protein
VGVPGPDQHPLPHLGLDPEARHLEDGSGVERDPQLVAVLVPLQAEPFTRPYIDQLHRGGFVQGEALEAPPGPLVGDDDGILVRAGLHHTSRVDDIGRRPAEAADGKVQRRHWARRLLFPG